MSAEPEATAQFLALAGVLERWAADLPRWSERTSERWDVFLERSYNAEIALAQRLRRLPTCRLTMCPFREHVSLALGGVRVRTESGLAAACQAWAQEVRTRIES